MSMRLAPVRPVCPDEYWQSVCRRASTFNDLVEAGVGGKGSGAFSSIARARRNRTPLL